MKFPDDANNAFAEYDVGQIIALGKPDSGEWWLTRVLTIGNKRGDHEKLAKFDSAAEAELFSEWLRDLLRAAKRAA